jgi:3-phenylpropionate/trans-cinnamate dioxygenase ferredoxin reductase subunit
LFNEVRTIHAWGACPSALVSSFRGFYEQKRGFVNKSIVVVGGGQAGAEVARNLRNGGFIGSIRLFGREVLPPYERPPLSKALLLGKVEAERLLLGSREVYEKNAIELFTGSHVEALDIGARKVRLERGDIFNFDACILATGAEARRPAIPGMDLEGVYVLRTIQDALNLRAALRSGSRLVVIGGGYLGLEVASSARASGVGVTVIEAAGDLLTRSISSLTAAAIEARHRASGTRLLFNTTVERLEGQTRLERVVTSAGEELPADAVLIAIGATPVIDLARLCGLKCNNGIVVDDHCRTSAAGIYAIGDCASQLDPEYGHHWRLEAVNSALVHARRAAADLLGKAPSPARAPSFWSEQCDFTLQILGVPRPGVPCEDVLRGDPTTNFSVYRFQDETLVTVEVFNRPKDFVRAHALIGRRNITPPIE